MSGILIAITKACYSGLHSNAANKHPGLGWALIRGWQPIREGAYIIFLIVQVIHKSKIL